MCHGEQCCRGPLVWGAAGAAMEQGPCGAGARGGAELCAVGPQEFLLASTLGGTVLRGSTPRGVVAAWLSGKLAVGDAAVCVLR